MSGSRKPSRSFGLAISALHFSQVLWFRGAFCHRARAGANASKLSDEWRAEDRATQSGGRHLRLIQPASGPEDLVAWRGSASGTRDDQLVEELVQISQSHRLRQIRHRAYCLRVRLGIWVI